MFLWAYWRSKNAVRGELLSCMLSQSTWRASCVSGAAPAPPSLCRASNRPLLPRPSSSLLPHAPLQICLLFSTHFQPKKYQRDFVFPFTPARCGSSGLLLYRDDAGPPLPASELAIMQSSSVSSLQVVGDQVGRGRPD